MNKTEFESLSNKVGPEAATMIFVLREVEGALMRAVDLKKPSSFEEVRGPIGPDMDPQPFPSLLQSAEDERRIARNEGRL